MGRSPFGHQNGEHPEAAPRLVTRHPSVWRTPHGCANQLKVGPQNAPAFFGGWTFLEGTGAEHPIPRMNGRWSTSHTGTPVQAAGHLWKVATLGMLLLASHLIAPLDRFHVLPNKE